MTGTSSISDIRQQLNGLNPSEGKYRQLFLELLGHRDLKPHIHDLQGSDLRGFVELLDKALNHFPVTDELFGRTLRRLQSTCSNREVLPPSYLIPNEDLSNRGVAIATADFADTHEAQLNGRRVCIKSLRSHAQDTGDVISKVFYAEVVVWKRMNHPNIVPFIGVPSKATPPFELVCDWMENGTIVEYVKKYPYVDRIALLLDVVEGLHYLHSCKIIHGSLKGANVLIDKKGRSCLTEFGLTSMVSERDLTHNPQNQNMASMTTWAAPEILQGGTATKEGDVFTFAMVAVETFTGRSPFTKNYTSALYDIMSGRRPERPETLEHDGLWEIVQKCWSQDPQKRPTTPELLEFFQASFARERKTLEVPALLSTASMWSLKSSASARSPQPVQDIDEREPPDAFWLQGRASTQHADRLPQMGELDAPDPATATLQRATGSRARENDGTIPPNLLRRLWNGFRVTLSTERTAGTRGRTVDEGNPPQSQEDIPSIGVRRALLRSYYCF